MNLKPLQLRISSIAALAFAFSFSFAPADDKPAEAAALGPVESFDAWRDSMSAGHFGDTFRLLPKRYQKDVNRLTSKFANKMDPDIWEGVVGIIGTVSNILTHQKEIVAGTRFFKDLDEDAQMKAMENWDDAAEMTTAFSKSDILDLEVWKKGNMGEVLNGPVSKLVDGIAKMDFGGGKGSTNPLNELRGAKAELVSEDGDSAVLRITGPKGREEVTEITRVQGRWVPAEMANGWDDGIAEASAALDQVDFDTPEFQQQKLAMMMGFGMVNQMLKQLEEAKSSDDFDRTIDAMKKLMGGAIPNQL